MFKLTIKTPQSNHQHRSGVFIVNFEHILHFFLSVSIIDFEQVKVGALSYKSLKRNCRPSKTSPQYGNAEAAGGVL